MKNNHFETLQSELQTGGPEAAINRLCETLTEKKDFNNLFYALLMKKRYELGVNPIPTSSSDLLPEKLHDDYEEGIRTAAKTVGRHLLDAGNIPNAWSYYSMLGEPEPVAEAIEKYTPAEDDEDSEAVINIAFQQGAHPKRGFDLILQQYGICSAITTLGGGDIGADAEVRDYCIKKVTRALYDELKERIITDIASQENQAPDPATPVSELIKGKFYLFADEVFHVDISHLGSVVQMSVHLPPDCEEFGLAREMCEYGERLSPQLQYSGEPPFDDQYKDYGIYLSILAGDNVEEGLAHFRKKVEETDLEEIGTYPAEVFVNLLLRIGREDEAVEVASKYIVNADERQLTCPGIVELCDRTGQYERLAEVAKQHDNLVHYLAGLIARDKAKTS